ncbi:hypothetical protein GWI33_021839 [Rhynchophorus ferrugineus]|uniref:Uncharacterized protein n=1 Tax=Rhynchophorus ferrugineus TaxID=354439 RepID=A0A834MI73_RHYFE|nr:hypothetical protein GWI33_021839 [Rhynchophorus ferrugineus]
MRGEKKWMTNHLIEMRKKSTGLSHKRSITYLVKPTVIRAPSTLRRPAKKTGKKSKQSKHLKELETSEDFQPGS